MKNFLNVLLICLCSSYILSQEKWGSYNTTIAGSHYTIVEACGDSVELSSGNWYEKMHIIAQGNTIEGAGRKVNGDSVFYKSNLLDNSAPVLLYDYSVEVDDTINGNWGEFVVTEVDTEFAIGKDRKRITMESTFDGQIDIWLSGLGSKISGYLSPGAPMFVPDFGSEFSCYLDNDSGEYYYGNQDPAFCMLVQTSAVCMTTSLDDIKVVENINIFPNPATDFITIKIENGNSENIKTQLHALDGTAIAIENSDGDNLTMDVSGLNAGIYLLEISQNTYKSYHKIVIQ
ncbi:MAG: hypothetical protein ACI9P5_004035 [Saprospiraceae bacterium]|jgi:hypothetical protein|tara:strand:+ start:1610 stop:2473 length:864 start_codon:yes stop_codon:yes gene_type:complete